MLIWAEYVPQINMHKSEDVISFVPITTISKNWSINRDMPTQALVKINQNADLDFH